MLYDEKLYWNILLTVDCEGLPLSKPAIAFESMILCIGRYKAIIYPGNDKFN